MATTKSRLRTVVVRGLWALAILLVGLLIAARVASDPVPEGQVGAQADALARRVEAAVNLPAWNALGAVRWGFMGRHVHTWDKQHNQHHVAWDEREVVIDLGTRRGCAREGGRELSGKPLEDALAKAYAMWVNDSFWLNPLGKFFDPGVVRKVVNVDGEEQLLITFTKNGLTPGDSYLWRLDQDGRPAAWRMWTMIPIGGLEASWESWQELPGGARVATLHRMMGFNLQMTDVTGAPSVEALFSGKPSPFGWCKVR